MCAIDARQLDDARVTGHETFQAQVAAADVLVFTKADLLTEAQREQWAVDGYLQGARVLVTGGARGLGEARLASMPRRARFMSARRRVVEFDSWP